MNSLTNVGILPTLLIALLSVFSTVLGCGVMPPGQSSTRLFTISGFTLPVSMAYTGTPGVSARVPGIAPNMGAAQSFVQRIVEQAVFDVLERQGRGAGLSDAIIAVILGQLTVQINYTPLPCPDVVTNLMGGPEIMMNVDYCAVVGNTVTATCSTMMDRQRCEMNFKPIPPTALSIGGTITTTNVIMANWSREMWQSVLDRVVRSLASGPFASNFVTASGVVA